MARAMPRDALTRRTRLRLTILSLGIPAGLLSRKFRQTYAQCFDKSDSYLAIVAKRLFAAHMVATGLCTLGLPGGILLMLASGRPNLLPTYLGILYAVWFLGHVVAAFVAYPLSRQLETKCTCTDCQREMR